MKLLFSIALIIIMIHNLKKKFQDIELMRFVIKISEYITTINVTNSKFYKNYSL